MDFVQDIYTLRIEKDNNEWSIFLYHTPDLISPLLDITLKPLYKIKERFTDTTQIKDIPRTLFRLGDYYQGGVNKHNTSVEFRNVSLLSIVHSILLNNSAELLEIKRVFSSSLNRYKEEVFFTDLAINFWNIQLSKCGVLPVFYFKNDKRYFLLLNN